MLIDKYDTDLRVLFQTEDTIDTIQKLSLDRIKTNLTLEDLCLSPKQFEQVIQDRLKKSG